MALYIILYTVPTEIPVYLLMSTVETLLSAEMKTLTESTRPGALAMVGLPGVSLS